MIWITHEHHKIDRIACPWLTLRPASTLMAPAEGGPSESAPTVPAASASTVRLHVQKAVHRAIRGPE